MGHEPFEGMGQCLCLSGEVHLATSKTGRDARRCYEFCIQRERSKFVFTAPDEERSTTLKQRHWPNGDRLSQSQEENQQ